MPEAAATPRVVLVTGGSRGIGLACARRFHALGERKALGAGIHHEAPFRSHGIAGQVKAPSDLRRDPTLDLDRPGLAMPRKPEQQIELGAGRGTEEESLGAVWCGRDE